MAFKRASVIDRLMRSATDLPFAPETPAALIGETAERADIPVSASRGSDFSLLWRAASAAVLAGASFIVLRGCNFEAAIPLRYLVYFLLQILIPGMVVLHLAQVRPLTGVSAIALGIPTGYAIEIFTFLGLSALHLRAAMAFMPVFWMLVGAFRWTGTGAYPRRISFGASPGIQFALFALFCWTVVLAAGHMYAEAPLVRGLPQRPIFHDWMYLLSRASLLRHQWPLEDPSLSGTPLQYHYFMLVHVASAAAGTGLETGWVMLRLAVIPLGLVLTFQCYLLGTRLSGRPWIGVLAAALLLVPGELSGARDYRELTYLGFFLRWLYVSPTFFFGLIYFGALVIAIGNPALGGRRRLSWIALLAACGTAAKGSVLPVVITATALWAAWSWVAERRFPRRAFAVLLALTVPFAVVYAATMSAWGAGAAQLFPFRICEITAEWQRHQIPITRFLKRLLHAPDVGTWLGRGIAALLVMGGTMGIRVLAVPFLCTRDHLRSPGIRWLTCAGLASAGFGLLLHLDSDGELYFLFLAWVPMAVLSAAACGALAATWWSQSAARTRHWRGNQTWILTTVAVVAVCAALAGQVLTTLRCEAHGWSDWVRSDPHVAINADLLPLYETTQWLREHTESDAILVSNAFTQPNLGRGRGIAADHTTVGVYYFYSALAERRMWIEGPTYLIDQAEARHRLVAAARFYYHHQPLPVRPVSSPEYAVIDHSLADAATVPPDSALRVFANTRFEVFRLLATRGQIVGTRLRE